MYVGKVDKNTGVEDACRAIELAFVELEQENEELKKQILELEEKVSVEQDAVLDLEIEITKLKEQK